VDDAISRVAEELSGTDDNLDFTALQAPLAPLATVKFIAHCILGPSVRLIFSIVW
jgi:hypothetical protein